MKKTLLVTALVATVGYGGWRLAHRGSDAPASGKPDPKLVLAALAQAQAKMLEGSSYVGVAFAELGHLESDGAIQLRIVGAVDDAEGPFAQFPANQEAADALGHDEGSLDADNDGLGVANVQPGPSSEAHATSSIRVTRPAAADRTKRRRWT